MAFLCSLPEPVQAQSYDDFLLVRNRRRPYRSLLQFRAGLRGALAEGESQKDTDAGHRDDEQIDGFVYYHSKDTSRREPWEWDMYAGTDGFYLGIKDQMFPGKQQQSRLEVFGRPKSFYREGYYSGDDYVPTGRYEGSDYGLSLGVGSQVDTGVRLDIAGFYKFNEFERNETTDPFFTIPDDYFSYGVTLTLEQNSIVTNRQTGLPEQGLLISLAAAREQNDSGRTWGVMNGGWAGELPSGIWRGQGRLEFYSPNGESGVWEVTLDGSYSDELDRVYNYRAEHPQGNLWFDGTLGYRLQFGESFFLTPYGQAQYIRTLDQGGRGSSKEVFYGGGLDMAVALGGYLSLVLRYSYLNNPSRPPVSYTDDHYGEHQFFVGLDLTFMSGRR